MPLALYNVTRSNLCGGFNNSRADRSWRVCAVAVCVLSILYALILGFVLFCGYGVYRRHNLREMLSLALSGIRTVKGILLTFLLIGVITALWRRSGTITFIICRALDLCGERVMLPAAFLLCALISYLTGTAFGTAATMGVICAALAAHRRQKIREPFSLSTCA